jgi:putative sigma-54 modulation protein
MRIQVKGRNVTVTDELRERVEKRFAKVGKQVSELATLEVELREERNPANPDRCVAEATLYLKGVTLRAEEASFDLEHSINRMADDMAVQVKRHREKRRKRREARAASAQTDVAGGPQPAV